MPLLSKIDTSEALEIKISKDEKTLFLADVNSFKIINIADVENPKIITSISIENSWGIALSKDEKVLYVAFHGGIKIFDISNLENPKLENTLSISEPNFISISKDGSFLYVPDSGGGFKIYNIKDDQFNPELISDKTGNEIGWGMEFRVFDDKNIGYFTASNAGFKVLGISDINNPTILSSYRTKQAWSSAVTKDKKIFVGSNNEYHNECISGIDVLDADLNLLTKISSNGWKITKGRYGWGCSMPQNVETTDIKLSNDDSKLFVATGRLGIKIYDIRDIYNIKMIDSYKTSNATRFILSNDETKIFLTDRASGVKIFYIGTDAKEIE